jgi:hypothetical protein
LTPSTRRLHLRNLRNLWLRSVSNPGIAAVLATILVSGCGTEVYRNPIFVRVVDRSHRLGPEPIQVGIFDKQMGYGKDWVAQWLGPSTERAPYSKTLTTTAAATIFDPPRPRTLEISFAMPALDSTGFYVLSLEAARPLGDAKAWYCAYDSYFPAADAPSIPVRYRMTPAEHGWRVDLDVLIE